MEPTAKSLARTYSDRVYLDPWEKVLDYRRVQEYAAKHPNAGRVKIGNALELPPSRVRGWINDGQPDPVRGIQTAIGYEWVDPTPDGEMAAALVRLAAHVMAGGAVGEKWFFPSLTPGAQVSLDELKQAFRDVGVTPLTRHDTDDGRATEVVVSDDASVLGRCLTTMGVPQGSKHDVDALPNVLDDVPMAVRREYVTIVMRHRAVGYETKATMSIKEDRTQSYRDELAALIRDVTGEQATAGERGVIVSADAVREIGFA